MKTLAEIVRRLHEEPDWAANLIIKQEKELEAKDKLLDELRDFDLKRLLGEAVLETMLTNSKLSAKLDSVRGQIKQLLTKDSVRIKG